VHERGRQREKEKDIKDGFVDLDFGDTQEKHAPVANQRQYSEIALKLAASHTAT
jgi:hypothetical protein